MTTVAGVIPLPYLAMPTLRAGEGTIAELPSYPTLGELGSLLGTYYVSWEPERPS